VAERSIRGSRWYALGVTLVAALALSARAGAQTYAPLDQPGPPLSVPMAQLQPSLVCERSIVNARTEPVLLNPATGVTPEENYSWNWEPALEKLRIPWCAYTAPYHTLGDIQTSGEYLVYAIRTEYALAHRKIAIIGHSQGGMSMRWALRFWPDTRSMVEDVIGFSGDNHGTTVGGNAECGGGCPPADWQQSSKSNFIRALNSYAETFRGISYTEIYTHTDEVVQPNRGPNASAALHTGAGQITNVPTQQVCPLDLYEHLTIGTVDPVAYALAVDALTHAGPADPARVRKSVCSELYMPGINPLDLNSYLQAFEAAVTDSSVALAFLAPALTGVKNTTSEPPLDCYVYASCRGSSAPSLKVAFAHRGHRIRVLVVTLEGARLVPVPGATVTFDGHHARTGPRGLATLTGTHGRLTATRRGCNPASRTV
jgi:pimeloyl-ACP methyl ester carboxylesterase